MADKRKLPKIKPCPAGHEAFLSEVSAPSNYFVYCRHGRKYDCWTGPSGRSRRAAIIAWNKRK